MKNTTRIFLSLFTAILLGTNAMPAFASDLNLESGKVKLGISNKTNEDITFVLRGPGNYTLSIPARTAVEIKVDPGNYTFSYEACGRTINGKLKVHYEEGATFFNAPHRTYVRKVGIQLPKCKPSDPQGGNTIDVLIENKTGGTLNLRLVGPKTYVFTLPPGNTWVSVVSGKYSFDASGSGCEGGWRDNDGKINFRTGYYWRWSCK
jgi:hypothetical protein